MKKLFVFQVKNDCHATYSFENLTWYRLSKSLQFFENPYFTVVQNNESFKNFVSQIHSKSNEKTRVDNFDQLITIKITTLQLKFFKFKTV